MSDIIAIATTAIEGGGLLEDVDVDELVDIMYQTDTDARDAAKLASTIVYIRKVFIEGMGKTESFKSAFKSRSVYNGDDNGAFPTNRQIGDDLSDSALLIKAKRVETSRLYKKVVTLLQTSLYVSYAMERMVVLDIALDKIKDEETADRDRVQYMNTFLIETRKPENAKKDFEMTVNVQNNNVSLVSIEDKLSNIANSLSGHNTEHIIEVLNADNTKD
jgi:hypothetical protein